MAVKIRLRRTGRKKQPSYRIVVADSQSPRDGAYLDNVGTYNPLTKPAELRIDLEKVDSWVARGAGMSETVASLVRKARRGGDDKVALRAASEPVGRISEGGKARSEPAAAAAAPAVAEPAAAAEPAVAEAPAAAAVDAAQADAGEPAAAESGASDEPAAAEPRESAES
jgi:small subunit ribosomal protein S16